MGFSEEDLPWASLASAIDSLVLGRSHEGPIDLVNTPDGPSNGSSR